MAPKDSFIFYEEWFEALNDFSDETLGKILRAAREYVIEGEIKTGLPPDAKIAFAFMRRRFDYDLKKYAERCEKNRENALKGGKKKDDTDGSDGKRSHPVGSDGIQSEAMAADIEREEDIDSDSDLEEGSDEINSRSQKLIFSFAKFFQKKFTTEFKPTTADKNAAGPLAGKLARAASKSSQPIQWLYLYFDNCYKHLNEYHKGRMAGSPIAWINDNFVEIHTKVFPHVPRFVEGGAHTLDAEYNKLYAVETPVTTSETPPDAGLVPSSGAGGVDEVQQPYTFEKATDEERAAIIRALK